MMQAMIFAAGLGTRLKPLTDSIPKALVEVGGETLLQRTIERLKACGVKSMVINVHHFAQAIVDYLQANNNFGVEIAVSDESQHLLDTGGGLKKAAQLFSTTANILIHNVDIISNVDLQAFYAHQAQSDALLLVSQRETKRYLLFNDDMRLVGWTNIETGEVRSYSTHRPVRNWPSPASIRFRQSFSKRWRNTLQSSALSTFISTNAPKTTSADTNSMGCNCSMWASLTR